MHGPSATEIDLITCEYPPDIGGVADYTKQVAESLCALGHQVRVWTGMSQKCPSSASDRSLEVSGIMGGFGPIDLWRTQKFWNQSSRRREILLQWTPTGYGLRGMNFFFPLWIALRVFQGDTLRITLHESFYGWSESGPRLKVASLIQRVMLAILLNSSKEVFTSTQIVAEQIAPLRIAGRPNIAHLPIPSNVLPASRELRHDLMVSATPGRPTRVGHFGSFHPAIVRMLVPTIEHFLRRSEGHSILLIGSGSEVYRGRITPELRARVAATGVCSLEQISAAINSCHFLFQPYPTGISSRHGTAAAALAHGKTVVSTEGPETEKLWKESASIILLASSEPCAMAEELSRISNSLSLDELELIGLEAKDFYDRHFAICNVITALKARYPSGLATESSLND